MRRPLIIIILSLFAVGLASCIQRKQERAAKKDAPVTGELQTIAEVDSAMRVNLDIPDTTRFRENSHNREVVYRLLAQALIVEPADLYRAALILQHAEPDVARECCLLAHKLAVEAAEKGHPKARFLAAAALDRYLIFNDLPQKFGTQYTRNRAGQYMILPYDTQTPDSLRQAWNVPPLDSIQAELRRMNPKMPVRKRR
jgi:hypothetical protein